MKVLTRKSGFFLAAVGVLVCSFILPGCGDLLTGDSDSERKNWAVVVGISNYQAPILNMKWCYEDAIDFYDALRRGKNWDSDKILLLTDSSATRDAIKRAIAGLAKRVSADDQVVFYFSGRGTYGQDQPPFDEGDGLDEYLAPWDSLSNSTARDLSDDELEALFSALPTNNVLIILDTSFGGGTVRSGKESKDKTLGRNGAGRGAPRGLDGMDHDLARPGYIMLTASQASESAFESSQLQNGIFTFCLVEGMRGAANPRHKTIGAQQAFEYATARTRTYVAGQMPHMIDNRVKSFRLVAW